MHSACLQKWGRDTCPICRKPTRTIANVKGVRIYSKFRLHPKQSHRGTILDKMNTPITSEQAQAYMTAMIGVSPSRYHEAVQSVITKHEGWSEPLIDLVLNAEDPITATGAA